MNQFEKRINALRLQFRDERKQIQKDCNLTIGHLNTAIGQVNTTEAREALRTEKARVYEATRWSMKYNRLCYMPQLEALEDEYKMHLDRTPSKSQLRRMMARVCESVDATGESSISFTIGDNRRCTIAFS